MGDQEKAGKDDFCNVNCPIRMQTVSVGGYLSTSLHRPCVQETKTRDCVDR